MTGINIVKYFVLYFLSLLALLCLQARAEDQEAPEDVGPPPDEIILKNGSRVLGDVTGARDGTLTIDTDFGGTLSISVDQIQSLRTTEPTTVLLADDTVITSDAIRVGEDDLVVDGDTAEAQTFALENLLVVNPEPWELGQGYRWTGLVSFALASDRGNTDTDELDYKLETYWRSKKDRYTIRLNGELDETNDQKNADNWQVIGKYDYFIGDESYWGMNVSAESDEFRDLDLRFLIGPYIGREFYTDPLFTLAAEIGASYVSEDFITAQDQEYPAANWYLRMSSDYLGGDSVLYFDQRGIWNLDETSDLVVDTGIGLSFPLLWGFQAAAEILWEYDSGAVEDVEDLDESYRFHIGYTW